MSLESVFKLSLLMNMVDHLTGPMASVTSSVGSSVSKLESMNQTLGNLTKTGAVMAGIGAQITDAALAPVEATFETRRAIGELASLGVKDLGAVEAAARQFSDQWAGTTKAEFISAAYDIKSGIASLSDDGVADMTQLAALTAKATKSTAAEMTSLFATGYGIYKNYYSDLSDLEFGEMFSGGISDAVRAFKTSGSGMAQSIQTLGASATNANVPFEEQLAILGMLQATMGGSEAGTKYKAFLRSAVNGGKELGLSFMDANNQMLSLPEILDKIRGKFGETMDAAEKVKIQKAFGDSEAIAFLDLMYGKTGELQDNILTMYGSLGEGVAVTQKMANSINNMEPDKYEVLKQSVQNLKESIGNSLLPDVNAFIEKADQLVTKVGTWIDNNQELVRVIMLIVLTIGGFLTAAGSTIAVVGGVGLILTKTISITRGLWKALKSIPSALETIQIYGLLAGDGIKKGFSVMRSAGAGARNMAVGLASMARQAITTAITALPGLIASVWSFTAALLANPITWIVIGIMALIAVIILLWQNWDQVTAFLQAAWNSACQGIASGIQFVKDGFSGIITWITEKISWFGEAGKKIIDTLVGGIKSVAMKPVEAIKGIFQKVRNLLPFSDAKEGPLSTLTLSGQRTMTTYAEGVALAQGAPARAIERGLSKSKAALDREPIKKVSISRNEQTQTANAGEGGGSDGGKKVIIEKLHMPVDLKQIKDLQMLLALLAEIEEETNGNDGDPDNDLVFA